MIRRTTVGTDCVCTTSVMTWNGVSSETMEYHNLAIKGRTKDSIEDVVVELIVSGSVRTRGYFLVHEFRDRRILHNVPGALDSIPKGSDIRWATGSLKVKFLDI